MCLFSPDGQYVAAGSSDGSLFIWDTNIGGSKPKREKCKEHRYENKNPVFYFLLKKVREFFSSAHSREVVVCSWDLSGQLFATADRNKQVTMWKR